MLRALFAGVSGLRNHQLRMDVIGNNIANVNTVAFKSTRSTFKEGFTQAVGGQGGVPQLVGSGVILGTLEPRFAQGALEATGSPLDLAVQGDSFFVVSNGQGNAFSRAGNFQIDTGGRLVLGGSEYALQGVSADSQGNLTGAVGDLVLNLNDMAPPRTTAMAEITGNLDAEAAVGETHSLAATVYDELGRAHELNLTFTNTGSGTWDWTATTDNGSVSPAAGGTVTFNPDGTFNSITYSDGSGQLTVSPSSGTAFTVDLVLDGSGSGGSGTGLTALAGASDAAISFQDGYPAGDLLNISINRDGMIEGIYGNGQTIPMGRISMATFSNPQGLQRQGGNVFEVSVSSGQAIIGFAGPESGSTITSGALETSNVDLSEEFTNMIITQRGFQANARVITTADEILNELINLRR